VATIRGRPPTAPYDYQQSLAARPDLQHAWADHNFGSFGDRPVSGPLRVRLAKEPGRRGQASGGNPRRSDAGDGLPRVRHRRDQPELAQNQILFSQTAKVQHVATLRFEWLLAHETLSISSLCLFNFTTQEWLITPRIGWRMSDAMTAYLGAQVFHGPTDTLFGLVDADLSAGYAGCGYILRKYP
jgi:hypothetical protein